MDSKINVCAVYPDGLVRIYGAVPKKNNGPRPFVRSVKLATYAKALQFAIEFEEKERAELARVLR